MSADPVGINGNAEKSLNDSFAENNSITKSGSPSKSEATNSSMSSLTTSPKDAKVGDTNLNHTPEYQKLIEYGLDDKVATRLEEIYKTGMKFYVFIYEYI